MDGVSLSICIPTGGTIKTETAQCLVSSIVTLKCCKMVSFLTSGYRYQNVNIGIQKAKDSGMTHLFILDADMIFPPDAIQKLIDHDKDIIGAAYNEKKLPLTSVVKLDDTNKRMVYIDVEGESRDIFKVAALGGGFMLIKMSVFEKLKTPYFQAPSGKTINDFTTEDYWFCRNVIKNGIDIWCDPSIQLGHIGEYTY